jgi:hypothetical protein
VGLFLMVAISVATACGGGGAQDGGPGVLEPGVQTPTLPVGKSCGTNKAVFTTPPIGLAEVTGWVPLGNLNPTGHLFPVDHQYLYHTNPDRPGGPIYRAVNVVAPGDIVISNARRSSYSTGNLDYSITFSPCSDLRGLFGHVQTITQAMLDQLGPFDQFCDTNVPAGSITITSCSTKQVSISVSAGTLLGTAGGIPNTSFGLDFLLQDKRVTPIVFANPARWLANADGFDSFHTVPSSDYFTEPASSQIKARLGQFDGSTLRTAAPQGGTIEVDVSGTAQGYWFNSARATHPEDPHLAIVPDNVTPNIFAFSMGTSQPGFPFGLYKFTPQSSGRVNRHPAQVTADGEIYCYQVGFNSLLLLQLVNPTTLRVEGRQNIFTCESQLPYSFTPGQTFDYAR